MIGRDRRGLLDLPLAGARQLTADATIVALVFVALFVGAMAVPA